MQSPRYVAKYGAIRFLSCPGRAGIVSKFRAVSGTACKMPSPTPPKSAKVELRVDIKTACVVGDSIWDMLAARRAGALGVGLLSGGYGRDELERSSAYRVYEDPADLLRHIDEVGGRG